MKAAHVFLAHIGVMALAVGATRIALNWTVIQIGGAAGLSAVVLAGSIASFIGAFIAGVVTDRFNRSVIVSATPIVIGVVYALVGALTTSAHATVYYLASLAFAASFVLAIHDNAARTLMPRLAEKDALRRLNGHFISLGEICFFLAPLLAGWAVSYFGAGRVLVASAITSCLAAFLGMAITLPLPAASANSVGEEKATSLNVAFFASNHWLIVGMVAATLANIFIVPMNTLLMPIRIKEVGLGPRELGYFYASISAGMAVAGLIRFSRIPFFSEGTQMLMYLGAAAPVYLLNYYVEEVSILVACGFCAGVLLCAFEVAWGSTLQERSPSKTLGRLYAIGSWSSFAGRATGVALCGWAASAIGARLTITSSLAVLVALLSLLAFSDKLTAKTPKCAP